MGLGVVRFVIWLGGGFEGEEKGGEGYGLRMTVGLGGLLGRRKKLEGHRLLQSLSRCGSFWAIPKRLCGWS